MYLAIHRILGSHPPFRLRSRHLSTCIGTAALDQKKDPSYALKRFIIDKIRATGPITVAEYMKTVVSAPRIGYYGGFSESRKIFGKEGDFVTAPELTQLFGELVGVWCYYELANTGHHGPWQLVECGPGTGQLMSDILRVMVNFQEKNVSVHLVECSDALIEQQERLLCGRCGFLPSSESQKSDDSASYVKKSVSKSGVPIYWYKTIDDIPDQVILNVFSLLTIHLETVALKLFPHSFPSSSVTNSLTRCQFISSAEILMGRGMRIICNGGFGIIIDYGHDGSRNDLSFRGYKKHEQVHPLSQPGAIDLTADVNFGYLKSLVADRAAVYGPNTQREFLGQMGIELRLRKLLKSCNEREKQESLIKSYNFLMGDMGERFLTISIFPKTLSGILEQRGGPAGFAFPRFSHSKPQAT
uniref:Protein arginine methyltransferase NDUFAF7 n=1 Tax=Angiostrongylus cantonensis TaxID=6313 RepID=A0A0K0DDC9_ANGCA